MHPNHTTPLVENPPENKPDAKFAHLLVRADLLSVGCAESKAFTRILGGRTLEQATMDPEAGANARLYAEALRHEADIRQVQTPGEAAACVAAVLKDYRPGEDIEDTAPRRVARVNPFADWTRGDADFQPSADPIEAEVHVDPIIAYLRKGTPTIMTTRSRNIGAPTEPTRTFTVEVNPRGLTPEEMTVCVEARYEDRDGIARAVVGIYPGSILQRPYTGDRADVDRVYAIYGGRFNYIQRLGWVYCDGNRWRAETEPIEQMIHRTGEIVEAVGDHLEADGLGLLRSSTGENMRHKIAEYETETDTRNRLRLRKLIQPQIRYTTAFGWLFDMIEEGRELQRIGQRMQTTSQTKKILRAAQSDPRIYTRLEDWDLSKMTGPLPEALMRRLGHTQPLTLPEGGIIDVDVIDPPAEVVQFLSDMKASYGGDGFVTSAKLSSLVEVWSECNGNVMARAVCHELRRQGCKVTTRRVGGNSCRVWEGVTFGSDES